eukprot:Plantae.Rhodophyta-Hildenbrandia_rubra.ctg28620.p1 GENE.Plantae.Rhodophyta-Hildenbrandia_rubra.ctg28620~~Plantae.Rhodophyta-Hildenbrandia_rubra.ctg28620.p1  ORF type:complete len:1416 (+),score=397.67 Plantae.Rhodophyta-Hildenbrandia_rubra.ctg28620:1150-5397(+)
MSDIGGNNDAAGMKGKVRGKRAQVDVQMWEEPSTIVRFSGIVEHMRSKKEDVLGFPPIEVTAKYLSSLAGGLTVFQEKALGRESPVAERRMTKLPHRVFSDFSKSGSLECLLGTCLRFKATHGLRRLDLKNMDKKSLFLEMLKMCEKNLKGKRFLPMVKVYFDDGLSSERVEQLRKLAMKRAVVVPRRSEATHVVYETPEGCSAEETDGTDYCRTLENRGSISLVHWWYYPDSYDQWISSKDVDGDPEEPEVHKGAWHVGARFLEDTHKFNEWMNEGDYEIAEEDQKRDAGSSKKTQKGSERTSRDRSSRKRRREEEDSLVGLDEESGSTRKKHRRSERGPDEKDKDRERRKEEKKIRDREKRFKEKEKIQRKKERDRQRQLERKRRKEEEQNTGPANDGGDGDGDILEKGEKEEKKLRRKESGEKGGLKIRLSVRGSDEVADDGEGERDSKRNSSATVPEKRKRSRSVEGADTPAEGKDDKTEEEKLLEREEKAKDEITPVATKDGPPAEEDGKGPEEAQRKKTKTSKEKKRKKKSQIGVKFVENAAPLGENEVPRIRNLSMEVGDEDREGDSRAKAKTASDDTKGPQIEKQNQMATSEATGDDADSARVKAVAESALQGKDGSTPATVADLVDSLPEKPVRIPAQARWFRFESIHDVERRALTEFFSRAYPSKTPKTYKIYRDFMIHAWRNAPDKYLTATSVRRQLAGDVCAILRVHSFLEHWGLINYGVSPSLRPAAMPLARTHAWRTTPVTVSDVKPKTTAVPRILFFDESQPKRKTAVPLSLKQAVDDAKKLPPGQVPLASRREIYAAAAATTYTCNSCGEDCSKTRYHSTGGADIDVCPKCFADGKYPQMLAARDFEQLTSNPQADDVENPSWSETETLLLLEGLEKYDDDWKAVAKHVGTKSKDECVLQFLRLPIEDSFLGDQLGKWGKGRGVRQFEGQLFPFADAGNPVMAQVAFLASSVSPEVAASAAQAALNVLMGGTIPEEVRKERERLAGTVLNGVLPEHVVNKLPKEDRGSGAAEKEKAENSNAPNGTLDAKDSAERPVMEDVQMANGADVSGETKKADNADHEEKQDAQTAMELVPPATTSETPLGANFAPKATDVDQGAEQAGKEQNGVEQNDDGQRMEGQDGHVQKQQEEKEQESKAEAVPQTGSDPTGAAQAVSSEQPGPEMEAPAQPTSQHPPAQQGIDMDRVVVEASAAVALAAAAARARKLADAEAREIDKQFAILLETKLRAMEAKMKHFEDFENHLRAERDRLEKQRRQMYSERIAAAMAKRKLKQSIDVEGAGQNSIATQDAPFGQPTFSLGPLQLPTSMQQPAILPTETEANANADAQGEETVTQKVAGAEGIPMGSPPPKSSPGASTDVSRQGSLEPSMLGAGSGPEAKMSLDTLPSKSPESQSMSKDGN